MLHLTLVQAHSDIIIFSIIIITWKRSQLYSYILFTLLMRSNYISYMLGSSMIWNLDDLFMVSSWVDIKITAPAHDFEDAGCVIDSLL